MLRDESVVVESSWACGAGEEAWRDLDRQLCSVAKRRGALDQEELTLIREAVATQLWRPLGMTSMREYLERRLGYGPQVAAERLRVAEALDALPEIDEALDSGELSYSAVRELTRIATPKTAGAWVKACRGKVVSQIQELVAEREPGDPPESKPKPQLRRRRFCADLLPDADALVRQARQVLEAEYGEKVDNDELLRAFAARVLEASHGPSDKAQRPRHQIGVTICTACKQGWQLGAGREIPISALDIEVALCDAQHMDAAGKLSQAIPAAIRRAVWLRDHGRCTIPGCRASCFIDVHHLLPRALGGTHEMSNLALLCSGHHRALHAGLIVIEGSAPDFRVSWISEVPHVGDLAPGALDAHESRSRDCELVPHVGDLAPGAVDANESRSPRESVRHVGDLAPGAIDAHESPSPDRESVPHVGNSMSRDLDARESYPQDRGPVPAGEELTPCELNACESSTKDRGPVPAGEELTPCEIAALESPAPKPIRSTIVSARRECETGQSTSRGKVPHVGDPMRNSDEGSALRARDVEVALVRLGFKRGEARGAVERAMRAVGDSGNLEQLMRAALRECPRPTS